MTIRCQRCVRGTWINSNGVHCRLLVLRRHRPRPDRGGQVTAVTYRPKLRGDVEFIGSCSGLRTRRLPVLVVSWLDERPMGRNGRPRNAITLPGHGKGRAPRNKGMTFPPEPLTPAEALALLTVIDPTTRAGVRNRALIALLWRSNQRFCRAEHNAAFHNRRAAA